MWFYCRWKDQSWSGSVATVFKRSSTTTSTWPESSWEMIINNTENMFGAYNAIYVTRRCTMKHSDKNDHHILCQSTSSNYASHSILNIYRTYTTHDQTKRSLGLYVIIFDTAHNDTGTSSLLKAIQNFTLTLTGAEMIKHNATQHTTPRTHTHTHRRKRKDRL